MNPEKKQQKAISFADLAGAYRMLDGGAVIPVNPLTKKPLAKWRHIKAKNPQEEIDDWSCKFPNAMLGVLCGERSAERYFVVDRDRHVDKSGVLKDGFASFGALEKKYGQPAPETKGTRTPGNGEHRYFKLPPGVKIKNSASQFAPGVDIRSTGGFVVAAGSMRADRKTYDHIGPHTIAEAPPWVLFHALFRSRQRERLAARGIICAADFGDLPVEQWTAKARELLRPPRKDGGSRPVCETARKEVLLKYALKAFSSEYEIIAGLPDGSRDTDLYASMTRCVSMLRGLEEEGFETSGLEVDVFNNVTDAAAGLGDEYQCWDEQECQRKWDSLIDAADAGDIEPRDLSNVGLDAKERASAEDEFGDVLGGTGSEQTSGPGTEKPKTRLEHCRDVSLEAMAKRQANALVAGIAMRGECGGLYGIPGSGKSFVADDLGHHVALGKEWHGKRVTKAPVLYVALEGKDGFRKRMKAAEITHGDPGDFFALLAVHVALDKTKAGAHGCAEIIAAAKELEVKCGEPVGLVVIDTFARAIAGDDENSAAESMAYLEKRAGEIARKTVAAVLTLYHPNKQGALRGSTAQPAGLDFILRIDRNANRRTLKVEKVKDGEEGNLFDFELEPVHLGIDDEGEPITSCTIKSNPPKRGPEPTSEKALREAFASLEKTEGRQIETGGEPLIELSLKAVRKAFAKFHGGSKAAVQKAFRRLADALPGEFEIKGKVIRRQTLPGA